MTRNEQWRTALDEVGELSASIVDAIVAAHGDRGLRAITAVSEGRIKQYRDFTVVVGHSDEYIVEDGYCTCKDTAYNLDPADPSQRCWHAVAVDIATGIDAVDHHDLWYADVSDLL